MKKKSKNQKSLYSPYLIIVAVVAIVAIVILVMNYSNTTETISEESTVEIIDEEGNLVGEATGKFGRERIIRVRTSGRTIPARRVCPTCLKDYEITAYGVKGSEEGDFKINEERFLLVVGDPNHELADGGIVGIDSLLFQNYVGGLGGVEWDLVDACPSDYAFKTYSSSDPNVDARFIVVSTSTNLRPVGQEETFNLNIGETKVLRDGAKIILKDSLTQMYAGGLNGVTFELIC